MPITRLGYKRLYWQLKYLLSFARWEVAGDLAAARAQGLTTRNLEWRTAREKQHLIESRIQDLMNKLATCEVRLSPPQARGQVSFGLFVKVVNSQTRQAAVYQMVGPYEADVSAGRLSIDSPVGRVLLGRQVGDWVTVYAPCGVRRYLVLDIFQDFDPEAGLQAAGSAGQ
ncbi:MAG: transcription elongation factor GreA [Deltaproteobacteria bacterium]|nr:transcription elongation factor GreA [Deltaproteobacteria bacterium]